MLEVHPWLSLVPPLTAILLAITTRQVIVSLLTGVTLGWIILSGSFWSGLALTIDCLVNVFTQPDQTRVIFFTLLMGAMLQLISQSGGVHGFVSWMFKKQYGQTPRQAQLLAYFLGMGVYIESSITCLVVGSVCRPLFDKLRISRAKLAYICDSTSAPVCLLIPFNSWSATILGLLAVQAGLGNLEGYTPLSLFIASMPLNFYVMFTLLIVGWVCWRNWHIGPMRQMMADAANAESTQDVPVPDNLLPTPMEHGVAPQARMMIIPLLTMVVSVLLGVVITGKQASITAGVNDVAWMDILRHSSGTVAVLWGVCAGITILIAMMLATRQYRVDDIVQSSFKGLESMVYMATMMCFAFAISATCLALGTGEWVASMVAPLLSPTLIAPLVFIVSCFIAFATGTSFGTFAMIIPLALPLANAYGADAASAISLPLVLSAVLGGSVFGDHCSPISDTTVLSSMASGCDHIDHVRSQLPYALFAASLTLVAYFIFSY